MGFFKTDYIPRSVLPARRITENTIRKNICPQVILLLSYNLYICPFFQN